MKLNDLKPDPKNPRTMTDESRAALGYSIEEFGDISGITFNERTGEIVSGHQRWQELMKCGENPEIKEAKQYQFQGESEKLCTASTKAAGLFTIRIVNWSKEKQNAANLAANSGLLAGDFTKEAMDLIKDVEVAFPDLYGPIRFDELFDEIAESFGGVDPLDGLTDPDDVPDPPDDPITKPGDLWLLGAYYKCFYCGAEYDLPTLRDDVSGDTLESAVLQRRVPLGAPKRCASQVQKNPKGVSGGEALAEKSEEEGNRPDVLHERQGEKNGCTPRHQAVEHESDVSQAEASAGNGPIQAASGAPNQDSEGVPVLRNNAGLDDRSHRANVQRRRARAEQRSAFVPVVQREEEAEDRSLCQSCGKRLSLTAQHKILCGDATKKEDVARLMDGARAHLLWADPPYGVGYVGGFGHQYSPEERKRMGGMELEGDALDEDGLRCLLSDAFKIAITVCIEGAGWYVMAPAGPLHGVFGDVLARLKVWRRTLVWVKHSFVMGRGDYHYRHEPIFYGWTPGAGHYFTTERTHDSVFEFDRPTKSVAHPTVKPAELVGAHIQNSTKSGWLIIDPFLGSGTTLIAAEQLGRKCYGMEIAPAYVDVAVKRWEQFTGQKALKGA